ncbi:hypothetical protein EG832_21125, partial [bacterium]|nr:hypothetical protein [bacterium]
MQHKLRWIFLGIGATAIGLGIFLYIYYSLQKNMPESLQAKADQVLTTGITITDPENDFALMGEKQAGSTEKPNNPTAYPLPYADVRSVSLGVDENYLYCRVVFWGEIPERPAQFGDDTITSTGVKVNVTNSQGEDQEIWMLGFGYLPVIEIPTLNTYYFYSPTGIKEPEDKRFSGRGEDSKVTGGAGTDFLMGAFPLARTGLSLGQEIYIAISVESASRIYDHATVDV